MGNPRLKFYKQLDVKDCGPTCLKMISDFYGRDFNLELLREYCDINKDGVSFLGILHAAQKIGLKCFGTKIAPEKIDIIKLPCIVHWNQNHFVVLYKIHKDIFYIADPGKGKYTLNRKEFFNKWVGILPMGVCLIIETTPKFFENPPKSRTHIFNNSGILFNYIKKYGKSFLFLVGCLVVSSLLQFITPFLTQSIVDVGISSKNLNFIVIVIISQIALLAGKATVEFIRTWVLLNISVRINISILTDFFIKLMKLPMSFFDSKMTGDILQRVNDQKRIEGFLTGPALNTIFSFFNLLVFSLILIKYSTIVFVVFSSSTCCYGIWIAFFMKKRRVLDFSRFELNSQNQSAIVQIVTGMQEIKLNNCEQQKRWQWESIQAKLFKYDIKSAILTQYQQSGGTFINEAGNAIIILICAGQVINGHLTLGAMIAVQFIIGQLAGSVQQFLLFIQSFQDASISLERLAELKRIDDEQQQSNNLELPPPGNRNINIRQLYFRYPGAGNRLILEDLNLSIPEGKTTAIVGMSGSGKTTILKLLLRFYEPEDGSLKVGNCKLNQINFKKWRSECGVVMQDGFIFSDSLLRNIVVEDDIPDMDKLEKAVRISNIQEFIQDLPLGLNTQIGAAGNGISQGQRQRILIARAVYKDPHFLFFDEATNSLDANNETVIIENLRDFFSNRTVVIVAHRLSTVTNADNIIVLNKGKIVEQGSHEELVLMHGEYFMLIKNQLELGV